jgi:2-hydroxychromene-2-carboxylate isomerase
MEFKISNKFTTYNARVSFCRRCQKEDYLNIFFDAYWRDNLDLSSDKEFSKLLESLKIDSKIFFEKITQQSIKDTLKKFTNDAFEKEVFGAPTFIVDNKIFWGQDRLEYALEELN